MNIIFWRKTRDIGPGKPEAVAANEVNPFPVQWIQPDDADTPKVQIEQLGPLTTDPTVSTPTPYNKTLTSADTEYSQALPANCRGFEFQARTEAAVRFAFVTGNVATPTAPYMTLKAGDYYQSFPLNQKESPSTLFLASATAGTVVEILAWV